jgi:hypothetical protein
MSTPLQQPHPRDRAPVVPTQRTPEPWWQDAALPTVASAPTHSSGVTSRMSDRLDRSRMPMRPAASASHPVGPGRHGAGAALPAALLVPRQRVAPGVPAPSPALPEQRRPREEATVRDDATVATTGLAVALDLVGRVGGAVTLAAVLVVAVAVGGAVDGRPASDSAPLTVTFEP